MQNRSPSTAFVNRAQREELAHSSSSRLASMMKGHSMSEAESFKVSESAYYNQLAEKYVPRGTAPEKVR